MKYSERVEIFEQVRIRYAGFLTSVLWKLTGDHELFTEAMQYALLGMWRHVEKLNGKKAISYIYRIALSANSKACRNRLGKDGQIPRSQIDKAPDEKLSNSELAAMVRRAINKLPTKQARAKLCCTEAGARSHVSKAIATLKDKLATLAERD
jgi:DNA-directed RNA polymerase specialized sigma24 family protein